MTPDPSNRPVLSRALGLAALCVLWWLAVLGIVAVAGTDAILWLLVLLMPPGLAFVWAVQRDVLDRLEAVSAEASRPGEPATQFLTKTLEARLADLAVTAARTEARLATFTSTRAAGDPTPLPAAESVRATAGSGQAKPTPTKAKPNAAQKLAITGVTPANAEQRQLELGSGETEPQEMPVPQIIAALNFPEDERDTAGFNALRRALKDPAVGRLVKASQDVLTLLSQDGIYMDDLPPDRAKPAVWRRFAQGERSRAMAELGGVRDRSSLALSAGRMREDVIFRDAAHHFLRLFDRTLMAIEPRATDAELVALTDTRTARAFMLLGRVAGTFD